MRCNSVSKREIEYILLRSVLSNDKFNRTLIPTKSHRRQLKRKFNKNLKQRRRVAKVSQLFL
jgi:hypothetical protein